MKRLAQDGVVYMQLHAGVRAQYGESHESASRSRALIICDSRGNENMAQHGIPPLWPNTIRTVRPDRSPHVMVFDMDALHPLPEALGTAPVGLPATIESPQPKLTITSIIRVLFMVPIYSIVSFLSYLFYRHAIYFAVIRDCYEAFAIASFFALMCSYIAPDLHNQKDYFRGIQPRDWVLPLSWFKRCCGGGEKGFLRTPRSGLTWFNVSSSVEGKWIWKLLMRLQIIWFGVFQYCFVRVFMTFVALVTQIFHRYCQESLSPAFAHIWVCTDNARMGAR